MVQQIYSGKNLVYYFKKGLAISFLLECDPFSLCVCEQAE